jgi:hypothetical protein
LQKLLDDISIKETFVPECLLKTVAGTEVAHLGELMKGYQVVIKGFPNLLCLSMVSLPIPST